MRILELGLPRRLWKTTAQPNLPPPLLSVRPYRFGARRPCGLTRYVFQSLPGDSSYSSTAPRRFAACVWSAATVLEPLAVAVRIACSSRSGDGGQPATSTSTGITLDTRPRVA